MKKLSVLALLAGGLASWTLREDDTTVAPARARSELRGRVLGSDGAPLRRMLVTFKVAVGEADLEFARLVATTDDDGRFSIPDGRHGPCEATFPRPGSRGRDFTEGSHYATSFRHDGTEGPLEFRLPAGVDVSGWVDLPTDRPASVRLALSPMEPAGPPGLALVSVTEPDEIGRFAFRDVPPGRYVLVACAEWVTRRPPPPEPPPPARGAGCFSGRDIPLDHIDDKTWVTARTVVSVAARPLSEVRVAFQETRVCGALSDSPNDAAHAWVLLRDENAPAVAYEPRFLENTCAAFATADEKGRFVLPAGLPPGEYSVRITADRGRGRVLKLGRFHHDGGASLTFSPLKVFRNTKTPSHKEEIPFRDRPSGAGGRP